MPRMPKRRFISETSKTILQAACCVYAKIKRLEIEEKNKKTKRPINIFVLIGNDFIIRLIFHITILYKKTAISVPDFLAPLP